MAARKIIFTTGETYHIFNRAIEGIPIFKGKRESLMFLETMKYYLQKKPVTRFSIYRTSRGKIPIDLSSKIVIIISYCLMPNHFHLLLRQEEENGIQKFVQKISNSFAHYIRLKNKNRGHLFEGNFKAVHIETENQLLHVNRYIHLNPVTSYLVNHPEDYPFSSYNIFINKEASDIVNPKSILHHFSSIDKYKDFVLSQQDYQRELQNIKHLILE